MVKWSEKGTPKGMLLDPTHAGVKPFAGVGREVIAQGFTVTSSVWRQSLWLEEEDCCLGVEREVIAQGFTATKR
jgi:hypothetical protein